MIDLPDLRTSATLGACAAALIGAIVIGFGALSGVLGFDGFPGATKRAASDSTEIGVTMMAGGRQTTRSTGAGTETGGPAPTAPPAATGQTTDSPAPASSEAAAQGQGPAASSSSGAGADPEPTTPESGPAPADPPAPPPAAPAPPAPPVEAPPAPPPAQPLPAEAPAGPIASSVAAIEGTVAAATGLETKASASAAPITAPVDDLLGG